MEKAKKKEHEQSNNIVERVIQINIKMGGKKI